jgi:hypothetical protein
MKNWFKKIFQKKETVIDINEHNNIYTMAVNTYGNLIVETPNYKGIVVGISELSEHEKKQMKACGLKTSETVLDVLVLALTPIKKTI